jgi:Mg-chelatase subunit ChlD
MCIANLRASLLGCVPVVLLALSCGANSGGPTLGTGAAASGGQGASDASAGGQGAVGGAGGSGGSAINLEGGSDTIGPATDAETCSADTAKADRIPLDVVILLDTSGSMDWTDSSNKKKYDAVQEALTAFLQDAKSADLQVGFQHFPISKPNVPNSCTNNASCGNAGPCTSGVCIDSIFPNGSGGPQASQEQWKGCSSATDCSGSMGCLPLGTLDGSSLCVCQTDIDKYCLLCPRFTSDYCLNTSSCDASQYKDLAVKIQPMATGGPEILQSMSAVTPAGATPTYPALSGALEAAKADVQANPTRSAIVLLATDGMPTICDPKDIDSIAGVAKSAADATPGIRTFVIGIFTDEDMKGGNPQENLDKIALAGGTQQATVIQASSTDVATQFLNELDKIRGATLNCEFKIPQPAAGKSLDYGMVNVHYTAGDGTETTFPYVTSGDKCGAGNGWYYDIDPATGGKPTKIKLCGSSCQAVQGDSSGKISFALGCKVITA